jgi:hypothetical protein
LAACGNGGWKVVEGGSGGGGWRVVLVAEGSDCEAGAVLELVEQEVKAEVEVEVEVVVVAPTAGGLRGAAVSGWDWGAGERPPLPRVMLATLQPNPAPEAPEAARLPLCRTLMTSTDAIEALPLSLALTPSPILGLSLPRSLIRTPTLTPTLTYPEYSWPTVMTPRRSPSPT